MDLSLLQERIGDGIRVTEVLRQSGAQLWVSGRDVTRHIPVMLRALDLELAPTPEEIRYFELQAAQAVGFRHLNIATGQPLQRRPNLVFYALNVGFATALASVLEEGAPLTFEQSLDILRGIASALAYARAHGMVHRQLDPELIFVDGDDVMVSGFVAAKDAESAPAISSTPYRAPELGAWRYEVDDSADIYSLGVIAFELISGRRIPALSSAHLAFADPFNIARDAPLRAGVSPHVTEAIMRAVARRPSLRFGSAEDFIFALESSKSEAVAPAAVPEVTPAPPVTQTRAPLVPVEPEANARPRRVGSAIGIGIFCVVGAFTLYSVRNSVDIPHVSSAIAGTLSRLTTRPDTSDSSMVVVPPEPGPGRSSSETTSLRRRRTRTSDVGVENGDVGIAGANASDSLAARRSRSARALASSGWMPIVQSAQYKVFADTGATVRQAASIAKVWVRTEFPTAQRLSDTDNRAFISSVNHYKLDCDAGTTSVGPGAFYDAAGKPIMSIKTAYTPLQQPSSGTPAEQILRRVCEVLRARQR
jgi:serine/threonine protein kinase